jgi:hypothetical protein
LAARKQHRIAEAELLAAPEPKNPAVCLLALRLPDGRGLAVTAQNYGPAEATEEVDLAALPGVRPDVLRGRPATDVLTGRTAATVSDYARLTLRLDALSGTTFVVREG